MAIMPRICGFGMSIIPFLMAAMPVPLNATVLPACPPHSGHPHSNGDGSGRPCATTSGPIMWGASGHPDQGGPYADLSPDQQMKLLVRAGLTWYRISSDSDELRYRRLLARFLAAARRHGINILYVIHPEPDVGYQAAYDMAKTYARTFPQVTHWELGNEYDIWVGMTDDGSDIAQYDRARYVRARETLRGLLDGVRAGNPKAKTMVNAGGWCHYGFLQQLLHDGLDWDITAYHWYSSYGDIDNARCGAGNVLAVLHSWGKPIWMTEFGSDFGTDKSQADYLPKVMRRWETIADRYNIQAAFIYQLLDQPGLPEREWKYVGLVDPRGRPKAGYTSLRTYLTGIHGGPRRHGSSPTPP